MSNQSDTAMTDAFANAGSAGAAEGDSESVRKYLNTKVVGVLMEGMKKVGQERPKDPLRVLGEYLLERSKEIEGSS